MMVSTQAEMSLADVGSYFDHSFVAENDPAKQEMRTCIVFYFLKCL